MRTGNCGGNVVIFQLRVPDSVRVIEGGRAPIQGWYSTTLNRRKRAPTVEATETGRTARYVTLLVPLRRADANVHLAQVSVTSSGVRFTLVVDGRRERVAIAPTAVEIKALRIVARRHDVAVPPVEACSQR